MVVLEVLGQARRIGAGRVPEMAEERLGGGPSSKRVGGKWEN